MKRTKKNPAREDIGRAVSAVVRHTSEAWDAAFPHIKSFARGGASLALKATKFTARHSAPLIQRGAVALGEYGRRKNPSPQQETPSFIRHVVAGILRGQMTKTGKNPTRADVSRAFAIAVGSAQKHGYLKPGTMTLTRKGVGKETYHRSHVETEDLYEAILEHVREGDPRRENPPRVRSGQVKRGTKFSHAMIARIAEYLSNTPPSGLQLPSPPTLVYQLPAHVGDAAQAMKATRANPGTVVKSRVVRVDRYSDRGGSGSVATITVSGFSRPVFVVFYSQVAKGHRAAVPRVFTLSDRGKPKSVSERVAKIALHTLSRSGATRRGQ